MIEGLAANARAEADALGKRVAVLEAALHAKGGAAPRARGAADGLAAAPAAMAGAVAEPDALAHDAVVKLAAAAVREALVPLSRELGAQRYAAVVSTSVLGALGVVHRAPVAAQ